MRVLTLIVALSLGCAPHVGPFVCDPSVPRQCVHENGAGAVCIAPVDRCAFADQGCAGGYRFDNNAGALSGQCVATVDMAVVVAQDDLAPPSDMTAADMTAVDFSMVACCSKLGSVCTDCRSDLGGYACSSCTFVVSTRVDCSTECSP